ncbi:MAG: hypothetical protein JNK85_04040 [Verrucomicrobiales bacterium]|nr:hypothetical protein [Verrucomicrobiales bacterium]
MTLSLASPRVFRIPVSYVALLLPVLPLLVSLNRVLSESSWYDFLAWKMGWLIVLTLAGSVIALGLPSFLESLGRHRRKEAEQLLGPWLASLFVAQVPLVVDSISPTVAMIVYTATCALLAAIPFGIEFQHRTLAALLTQPVDRRRIATEKLQMLGLAVGTHTVLFLVAWQSTLGSFEPSIDVLIGLAIGFAVAGTTPWWTLVTRGVLPGMVFAGVVPLVIAVVWGWLAAQGYSLSDADPEHYPNLRTWVSGVSSVLATVLPPVGAALGLWGTLRRWIRLEARDGASLEREGIFAQGIRCSWLAPAFPRGPVWKLLLKEIRLQTVTWATLGLSLVSALLVANLANQMSISYLREYLNGLVILFGAATLIFAGATSLAEERRLGTLDGQLLLPASRGLQWWLKVVVCLLLAVPAAWTIAVALPSGPFVDRPPLPLVLTACAWAFTMSFLASSGSTSTLRALILSIVLSAVTQVLLTFQWTIGPRIADTTHLMFGGQDPEHWITQANALGADSIEALRHRLTVGSPWTAILGLILVFLPLVLPWFFSWRNFIAPMQAVRRLRLQIVASLLFFFACVVGALALQATDRARSNYEHRMVMAWDTARYRDLLSRAEERLWRTPTIGLIPLGVRGVNLLVWTPVASSNALATTDQPQVHQWVYRNFSLPLTVEDRETIVRQARIPHEVREALRLEANLPPIPDSELPPRPTPSTPPPGSAQQILLDPALAARYGLVTWHLGTTPPSTEPANPSQPSAPSMSPELMRRYGLTPAPAAAVPSPTNAAPTNADPSQP